MLAIALLALALPQDGPPAPEREFRAAWVATVDNIDWPSKRDLTTQQAQAELVKILDTAKRVNLNALILQVRPAADALFESKLEPWSEYLTGAQGKAPSPYWDPLAFAIDEAHKRGIELHAWFNPYRAWHPSAKGNPAPSHISKTTKLAKIYGTYLWLDPGEKKVQDHSIAVMLDVVRRYDLDGVHIDDYFYPYPIKDPADPAKKRDLPFPDQESYSKYQAAGGKLGRSDWRRANVDGFVKRLYDGIKGEKPWVKFGISPFGIYRPGVPKGIAAGIDQYEALYADALKWLVEGWCDYYTPQLYWPIAQKLQSYPVLLDWWVAQNPKKRNIWPGNFTSQLFTAANWPVEEILNQIDTTRDTAGASGNVHFSMKAITNNSKGLADQLLKGPYKRPALVPASPWLDSRSPKAPNVAAMGGGFELFAHDPDVRFVAIYERNGNSWEPPRVEQFVAGKVYRCAAKNFAVSLIDRTGNESLRTTIAVQ